MTSPVMFYGPEQVARPTQIRGFLVAGACRVSWLCSTCYHLTVHAEGMLVTVCPPRSIFLSCHWCLLVAISRGPWPLTLGIPLSSVLCPAPSLLFGHHSHRVRGNFSFSVFIPFTNKHPRKPSEDPVTLNSCSVGSGEAETSGAQICHGCVLVS